MDNTTLLVLALIPLFLYVGMTKFYGQKAGIWTAILSGVALMGALAWVTGELDETILIELGLIIALGGVALKMDQPLVFKFQPVVVGVVFGLFLLWFEMQGKPYLQTFTERFAKVTEDYWIPVDEGVIGLEEGKNEPYLEIDRPSIYQVGQFVRIQPDNQKAVFAYVQGKGEAGGRVTLSAHREGNAGEKREREALPLMTGPVKVSILKIPGTLLRALSFQMIWIFFVHALLIAWAALKLKDTGWMLVRLAIYPFFILLVIANSLYYLGGSS